MATKPKTFETLQFVGSAQKTFSSLIELATDSLDNYCPNWNNPENPASYIFPPVFSFKNPETSDKDIEDAKKTFEEKKAQGVNQRVLDLFQRAIIDRQSDHAEYLVFQALQTLVQDNIQIPFLAVHSLDLDHLKNRFSQIFPHVQENFAEKFKMMMREYDYVLIGPRIGVIIIEVHGSAFTREKDFNPKRYHLPDSIVDGTKQLNSFDLEFFHECAATRSPAVPLRKILFTPNLQKWRLKSWYDSLDHAQKNKVDSVLSGITHWFQEDMINFKFRLHSKKPPLYDTLYQMMESDGFEIPFELFQSYGATLAGLKSVMILKDSRGSYDILVDPVKLSERLSLETETEKLVTQDPAGRLQEKQSKGTLKHSTSSLSTPKTLQLFSKILLCTPQQQEALNGPNRQFIIGSAGTGKTIVLQEKAHHLLKEGLKVLILAPESSIGWYKKLFDFYGLHALEVRSWTKVREDFKDTSPSILEKSYNNKNDPLGAICSHVESETVENSEKWRNLEACIGWMANFDAVLIDDAFDHLLPNDNMNRRVSSLSLLLIVMAYWKHSIKSPEKTIWIALDPLTPFPDTNDKLGRPLFISVVEQMREKHSEQKWSCVVLDKVVRSSENISKEAYENNVKPIPELGIKHVPLVGHKIVGQPVTRILDFCKVNDAPAKLWVRIKHVLDGLLAQKIPLTDISIVVGGYNLQMENVMRFLIEQLQGCSIPLSTQIKKPTVGNSDIVSGDGQTLSINYWDVVSSLEWPIVIFAAACEDFTWITNPTYKIQRYRGYSRATTKLVEVIAVYNSSMDVNREGRRRSSFSYGTVMTEETTEDHELRNMAAKPETLVKVPAEMCLQSKQQKRFLQRSYNVDVDLDSKHRPHEGGDSVPQLAGKRECNDERKVLLPELIGPNGLIFDSYEDQASYYLYTYCKGWCDYDYPVSHLIPRKFQFSCPDNIDNNLLVKVLTIRDLRDPEKVAVRINELAKCVVYRALCQVVRDGIGKPFIVIHNLTVDDERLLILQNIFPDANWRTMKYDFIIIGPQIGLCVIEVIASAFVTLAGFHLIGTVYGPNDSTSMGTAIDWKDYIKATLTGNQNCFQQYSLKYLEGSTNHQLPATGIQHFLVNLDAKEGPADEHWSSLMIISMDGISQLDETQKAWPVTIHNPTESAIFGQIKYLLETGTPIRSETYEAYSRLLTWISTVTTPKDNRSRLMIRSEDYSYAEAIKVENATSISSQNFDTEGTWLHVHVSKDLNCAGITPKFITLEQKRALGGGRKQIIIGAAGTGKTVVFQLKALELLNKGESVFVFAPGYSWKLWYQKMIIQGSKEDVSGRFKTEECSEFLRQVDGINQLEKMRNQLELEMSRISQQRQSWGLVFYLIYLITSNEPSLGDVMKQEWLQLFYRIRKHIPFDHVFFDDAFGSDELDNEAWSCFLCILALAHLESSRTVWIATDCYCLIVSTSSDTMATKDSLKTEVLIEKLKSKLGFSETYLKFVIRCSEEVYRVCHTDRHLKNRHIGFYPIMGHNIQGIAPSISSCRISCYTDAWEYPNIQKNFLSVIPLIDDSGRLLNSVAILISDTDETRQESQLRMCDLLLSWFPGLNVQKIEEMTISPSRPAITVASTLDAFSLEWPVIIHIIILPEEISGERLSYLKYIARSRAVVTFVEFHYVIMSNEPGRAVQPQAAAICNQAKEVLEGPKTTEMHMDLLYKLELEALGQIPDTDAILKLHINSMSHEQLPTDMNLYYDNYSTPKGLTLLICNHKFQNGSDNRKGAFVDLTNLHILFHKLGYDVHIKIDRTATEMLNDVKEFVGSFNGRKLDSCIIVVMTLGIRGTFIGIDGKRVNIGEFLEPVQQSTALINKPKLFIIQAERPNVAGLNTIAIGEEKPDILSLIKEAESESKEAFGRSLPYMADSIVVFSPTPAFFSWKESERGSWFIQTICEEFSIHAHELNIASLSQTVINSYSKKFQNQQLYLGVPQIYLNLTRKWHFFPYFAGIHGQFSDELLQSMICFNTTMGLPFSEEAVHVIQVLPAGRETVKHLLDIILKKPPEQSCPVDTSVIEQAKKNMDEWEIEIEKTQVLLDVDIFKLAAHGAKHKEMEPGALRDLRQQAYQKFGLDSVNKINICVTGKPGVGKSSLINGLRNVDPDDPAAAIVDINESTAAMTQYSYPSADHIVLWDCPGADTLKHPRDTYFFDNYLYAFDYLLIVFTDRFGEAEIDMIKQAIAHRVPVAVIRNKVNYDFSAKRKTDKKFRALPQDKAIATLIMEHRRKTIECLREADIAWEKVGIFVVNVHSLSFDDEIMFEEPLMVEDIFEVIFRRRYGKDGK